MFLLVKLRLELRPRLHMGGFQKCGLHKEDEGNADDGYHETGLVWLAAPLGLLPAVTAAHTHLCRELDRFLLRG